MSPTLDALLCQRYALIFADRHRPVAESCMGRGFECEDGWFDILDALCERMQFLIDHNGIPQIQATQVKEKFGTLRFHVNGGSEEITGMLNAAEAFSSRVCELCGKPGKLSQSSLKTCCQEHA